MKNNHSVFSNYCDFVQSKSVDFLSPYIVFDGTLSNRNFLIIPSFVDVHVHLREPGFFYKENIKTGTLAACSSGYTTVFSMPNLKPTPDSYENLKPQLEAISEKALINVLPYGTITKGEKGCELSDMDELAPYVIAFTDDGVGLNDASLMEAAMKKAKALGKIIVAHCEDMTLRNGGYIHQGQYAKEHGHLGICSESEWLPIKKDLELVEKTGCAYHVCHVSTKESVDIIRKAKAKGLDVSCETAPHYLVLNDMDLKEDGRFKMNPPIRSEEDRLALIEGIKDGTIDMIATDHAPHSAEEKSKGLKDSAMGVVGLETAFPILYTKLVKENIITMEKLIELMSTNPRKRFNLQSAKDENAFSVWDVTESYQIEPDRFKSMGKSTPFDGELVYGRCLLTVKDGNTLWSLKEEN